MRTGQTVGGIDSAEELMQNLKPSSRAKISKEKLFRIIAEFSVDWIYWINPDGAIGFMSPSSKYITGYRPEEFLRDPELIRKLIAPEDQQKFIDHQKDVEKGRVFCSDEYRIITRYGEKRWISHACQSVYDDNNVLIGRYVSNRDVTNLKNDWCDGCVKDEIYKSASIGNYQMYPNGKLKYANEIFLEMLGYKSVELISGKNLEEFLILNKEKRQKIKHVLDALGSMKNIESEWIKSDGSIIYIRENLRAVKDKTGNVIYYEGVTQNVTNLKKAEISIIEVENRERKLEKLKAEFLATISHEIRTPINVILNLTKMLRGDIGKISNAEVIDNAEIIENESKRIQRTIDLILDMSQLVTGTYDYKPEVFDLYEDVLKQVYLDNKNFAEKKNLEFILSDSTIDSTIIADKYSYRQIFHQLVDNAIKYTKSGKVEINLHADMSGNIEVDIIDTGIGIDKKYLPYLFTTFSQEDNSYSRMFEGTGLGLAIVKKYCDLNDAMVKVESEKGKGTSFRITFPKSYEVITK